MPWDLRDKRGARLRFIEEWLRGKAERFSLLCRRHGISRVCGYKWVERFKREGRQGLSDHSRRPKAVERLWSK